MTASPQNLLSAHCVDVCRGGDATSTAPRVVRARSDSCTKGELPLCPHLVHVWRAREMCGILKSHWGGGGGGSSAVTWWLVCLPAHLLVLCLFMVEFRCLEFTYSCTHTHTHTHTRTHARTHAHTLTHKD